MTGTKYEWAITPILAKRLVSNCDTNLLMTISTFEEVAVLSVAQSHAICAGTVCTNRWLTTVSPQTSVETTETSFFESSGNDVVRNKND